MKENITTPNGELDHDKVPDTDIDFECPHCQKRLLINRRGAGRVVSCTACLRSFTVPIPEDMKTTTPDSLGVSESPQKKRAVVISRDRILNRGAPLPPQANPLGDYSVDGAAIFRNNSKVISVGIVLLIVVAVSLMLFPWNQTGRESFNGTTVSYESVPKRDVERLGLHLKTSGFANRDRKIVDFSKPGKEYAVKTTASDLRSDRQTFANGISSALNGKQVRVYLSDTDGNIINTVTSDPPKPDPTFGILIGVLVGLVLMGLWIAILVWIVTTPIRVAKRRGVTDPELGVISTLTWVCVITSIITSIASGVGPALAIGSALNDINSLMSLIGGKGLSVSAPQASFPIMGLCLLLWVIALFLALVWKCRRWMDKDEKAASVSEVDALLKLYDLKEKKEIAQSDFDRQRALVLKRRT